MIRAVIFDMDGLMFDTESIFFQYFDRVCEPYGLTVPEEVIKAMIGVDSATVDRFEEEYPGITRAMKDFQRERLNYYFEMFPQPKMGNKKGLEALIAVLNREKIPYAIASSSALNDIQRLIDHADCDIRPACIISSKDEGLPSKPQPDIFLRAGEELGVAPQEILVLEDSKNGVLATRKAGMQSVYIPDKISVDRQMYPYVHTTCQSLDEVIEIVEKRENIM
ncbi:MAG: HAD family phosphatase [Erysipelotrichaceae bacterium]|nr:HAD family phosphatase [Erysipelotrichaceae bacterium]